MTAMQLANISTGHQLMRLRVSHSRPPTVSPNTFFVSASSRTELVVLGAAAVDATVAEIVGAGIAPAGQRIALQIHLAVRGACPDATAQSTDDGGITLEYVDAKTHREIAFAIPGDGSVRYFVARAPGGFREAGIVLDESAVAGLVRWLVDERTAFPVGGLALG
jgi:hypothetical protein